MKNIKAFASIITLTTCLNYNLSYASSNQEEVPSPSKNTLVKLLDRNEDGKINFDDVRHVLDRNKDGKINFDDVRHVAGQAKAALLKKLDFNKDGKLDLQDAGYVAVNFKHLVVDRLDIDGNGTLDMNDVRALAANAKNAIITQLLDLLDFDGDGKLSLNDFRSLLDANGDGKISFDDFTSRFKYMFDRNNDGEIDATEVFATVIDVFGSAQGLAASFDTLITDIRTNTLFASLPTSVQGVLNKLFDRLEAIGARLNAGIEIAEADTNKISTSLKKVKQALKKTDTNSEAMEAIKPELKALLARVDLSEATGEKTNNATTKIFKALN
jgi:Ca2+-binding EF-hand superfamily protein